MERIDIDQRTFLSSVTRRAFIEAKYVQKAFLRPLPTINQMRSSSRTIRRWTINRNTHSSENEDDSSKSTSRHLSTR